MLDHSRAPALVLAVLLASCAPGDAGFLIRDVRVVDGTGAPESLGSVRVRGDRVTEVGLLEPRLGETVIEGRGMVLAPGFVDTHSHHAGGLLDEQADAVGAVSQGITTIVTGQDGGSRLPVGPWLARVDSVGAAVNVASYTGFGSLREAVLGDDYARPATAAEVDSMAALLAFDLDAGSLGLSTGLEYDPDIYAPTEEVLALAHVVAGRGGRYISHMRSEDRRLFEAVDELVRIGREAGLPVQVSHMKLAMRSLWGRADELLARLESARAEGVDVTADVYPYLAWQSTMTVLFPDRAYTREAAAFALDELAPPEGMLIGRYSPEPSYAGKTLAQVAALRGEDPVTTYLALIEGAHGPGAPEGASETIVARSMAAEDVAALLAWPHTNVSSDGSLRGAHPRGWGAFTRVLAAYVREERWLGLEQAIHKMTGLSAEHVGLADRGVIRPGGFADLVLFDPATVADRATFEEPHRPSVGVAGVWVNGRLVWDGAAPTGARPGRALRRAP